MNIPLTPQQQHFLDSSGAAPGRVIDPRTNVVYVLVPENDYLAVQELLEEERRQQAIHAMAIQNAIGRMNEET